MMVEDAEEEEGDGIMAVEALVEVGEEANRGGREDEAIIELALGMIADSLKGCIIPSPVSAEREAYLLSRFTSFVPSVQH
jgi:hypothetical protein